MGKQKMLSFIRNSPKSDNEILDLIHSDVYVPHNIKSLGGASYFVTFVDDASRKVRDFPIKSKDQVLDTFQKFHMVVERETNRLIICIRTNNGKEYCSNSFEEYYSEHGIKHLKIVPRTPQQNRTTERMNQTIMEKVRSMLSYFGLPKYFWVEVVRTTCYLINHSPTTSLDGGIPEKVWAGKDLCYTHLSIFGCESYVHIPKEQRSKLDEESLKCVFLGYFDNELVGSCKKENYQKQGCHF